MSSSGNLFEFIAGGKLTSLSASSGFLADRSCVIPLSYLSLILLPSRLTLLSSTTDEGQQQQAEPYDNCRGGRDYPEGAVSQ